MHAATLGRELICNTACRCEVAGAACRCGPTCPGSINDPQGRKAPPLSRCGRAQLAGRMAAPHASAGGTVTELSERGAASLFKLEGRL